MKLKSNKTYITFYSYLCSVNKLNCIINSKLIMYAGKGNVLQKNLFPIQGLILRLYSVLSFIYNLLHTHRVTI